MTDQEERDTTEIPVAKSGDEVVDTEVVPTEWYEHVERARDVRSEIATQLRDNDDIISIGIGRDKEREFGSGLTGMKVIVRTRDSGSLPDLDDEVDGIPIEIRETDEKIYDV